MAFTTARETLAALYEEGGKITQTTARDISLQAFYAAEQAHPDLQIEIMVDVIWGALNEDARGLFKGAHKNAKSPRGRTAMKQFITDVGYDVLLPRDSELSGWYQDQAQHLSDMMVAWLVDPADVGQAS